MSDLVKPTPTKAKAKPMVRPDAPTVSPNPPVTVSPPASSSGDTLPLIPLEAEARKVPEAAANVSRSALVPVEPAADGSPATPATPTTPAAPAFTLCPYCGQTQTDTTRCDRCKGLFEPLSRQATQNNMGPWQVRNEANPFSPGLSFEKLAELVSRGRVRRDTIIRGPTTRQFWTFACNTPGVAALLGECHSCHRAVRAGEFMCRFCEAPLNPPSDRQHLGLSPVQLLPGQAPAGVVASSVMAARNEAPPVVARSVAPVPAPVAASAPMPVVSNVAGAGSSLVAGMVSGIDMNGRKLRKQFEMMRMLLIFTCVACIGLLMLVIIIKSGSGGPATDAKNRSTSAPAR